MFGCIARTDTLSHCLPGSTFPEILSDVAQRKQGCIRADAPRHRILTYNVHACVGTDRRLDPGRIAEVIASCQPDVCHERCLELCEVGLRIDKKGSSLRFLHTPTITSGPGNLRFGRARLQTRHRLRRSLPGDGSRAALAHEPA